MKAIYLLLSLLFVISCSSDDDSNSPLSQPEIEGEWKLAYLLDENDMRWDPLTVCNSSSNAPTNLGLNISYYYNDSILTAEGFSPCNTFYLDDLEFGADSYTASGFTISMAECMPAYLIPDCQTDGNEFEQLMIFIFTNHWTLEPENPVSFDLERFGNNDTLRIVNDSLQSAVYWRTLP